MYKFKTQNKVRAISLIILLLVITQRIENITKVAIPNIGGKYILNNAPNSSLLRSTVVARVQEIIELIPIIPN
ncbi:MAG: hypothetical protein JWQ25_106 [Daejeonella sp.]|nr:hypothetical protein [Daejeonella sp.]